MDSLLQPMGNWHQGFWQIGVFGNSTNIVFTDLFAASPYNQAALCANRIKDVKIQLITGVNLPMIIEAINARMMGQDIEQITDAAFETAKVGIKNFWDELKSRNPQS